MQRQESTIQGTDREFVTWRKALGKRAHFILLLVLMPFIVTLKGLPVVLIPVPNAVAEHVESSETSPPKADRLPTQFTSESVRTGSAQTRNVPTRRWAPEDIVGVRLITDLAISDDGRRVAFIIRESFPESGDTRFGLYVQSRTDHGSAKKIKEGPYIADLARHPGTDRWTVRADIGAGVQLYDVDDQGAWYPLVINSSTGLIGTWHGLRAGLDMPHEAGVISFEWSADGAKLWYSRFRLRSQKEQQKFLERGILYDSSVMTTVGVESQKGLLLGTELHLLDVRSKADTVLAFAPTNAASDLNLFTRRWGTAGWDPDSRHIRYSFPIKLPNGGESSEIRIVDTQGLDPATRSSPDDRAVIVGAKARYLKVKLDHERRYLVESDSRGKLLANYGEVPFERLSGNGQAWVKESTGRIVLGVQYADHDGLTMVPDSDIGKALRGIPGHLSECTFGRDLEIGACVRESIGTPPEVIMISLADGSVSTLIRPNASYDELVPLTIESAQWTNRYGLHGDGYITYPRDYIVGKRYPIIVVTHGRDARNQFLNQGFQWEFPVQVLAELGYLVLSVNEPEGTFRHRAQFAQKFGDPGSKELHEAQFSIGLNAVATMEAAVNDVVSRGIGDAGAVGIAGYSRGAEIVVHALSLSKVFHAGITGDGIAAPPSGYWLSRLSTAWISSIYGGSPFSADPEVLENYRRFAPSFRAAEFSGPLLQLVTAMSLYPALELNTHLREAHIPSELVYYSDESHIFWNPRHRIFAMHRVISWFNYWLLGKCNGPLGEQGKCARWDALRRLENGNMASRTSLAVELNRFAVGKSTAIEVLRMQGAPCL